MSAQDYFHEKAEESRHNEMIGYIMFLAGSVFFVGGILTALSLGQPSWFLFIPYSAGSGQALGLEASFLIVGIALIAVGVGCGLHFNHDRSMYMHELFEASNEDKLIREYKGQDFKVQKSTAKRNNRS